MISRRRILVCAKIADIEVFIDGKDRKAVLYNRAKLKSGNVVEGPAIVQEMDATTLILPDHAGIIDDYGNILMTLGDDEC